MIQQLCAGDPVDPLIDIAQKRLLGGLAFARKGKMHGVVFVRVNVNDGVPAMVVSGFERSELRPGRGSPEAA